MIPWHGDLLVPDNSERNKKKIHYEREEKQENLPSKREISKLFGVGEIK